MRLTFSVLFDVKLSIPYVVQSGHFLCTFSLAQCVFQYIYVIMQIWMETFDRPYEDIY